MFARDIDGKTAQQVKETLQSYQNASNVPMIFGVDGVLWAGPAADALAFILAAIIIIYEMKLLKTKEA